MRIPWNIVTKNLSPDDARLPLEKKVQQKIAKFDRHLAQFPPDTVHLQIVLEKHPRKDRYLVSLTLRVPSDILHSEEAGRDLVGAFDNAVKSLLRKLKSYKSSLRREKFWKRKERREKLHAVKATGFALEPQNEGEGPQTHKEVVRELFQQHEKEFLRHVRRHILQDELAGELPKGAVNPREVLNEVARRAEAKADKGPKRGSWLTWFYHLIHQELKRQRWRLKQEKGKQAKTSRFRTVLRRRARPGGNRDGDRPAAKDGAGKSRVDPTPIARRDARTEGCRIKQKSDVRRQRSEVRWQRHYFLRV